MLIPDTLIAEAAACVQYLRQQSLKVSFVESCTGGLLAFVFSCIPGVSSILFSSAVTYSTCSKHSLLGISQPEIDRYGVVSSKIAAMMAENTLRTLEGVDIALSLTGIAGGATSPTDPAPMDPETGIVYIGLARRGSEVQALRCNLGHLTRFEVQKAAVQKAINLITASVSS